MATFDLGGGCPCGLYKYCECGGYSVEEVDRYNGAQKGLLMAKDDFDFGFTGVDVPDPSVTKTAQDKLDSLRTLLTPFLTNLMKDPDKKYLHWPDRVAKMTEFKAKVDAILK